MKAIRLKSYKTFLDDGRSSVTFGIADKREVFVALILGVESAKITDAKQCLDIDDMILRLAAHIQNQRKQPIRKKAKLK